MLSNLALTRRIIASLAVIGLIMTPVNAEEGVAKPGIQQTSPKLNKYQETQVKCLTENMYFEAGNQGNKGMIAVTNVVINRTKDDRFPDTPCKVIHQKKRGKCQFSWVCMKKKKIQDAETIDRARRLAEMAVTGHLNDLTKGAKFYHATYVHPRWKFTRVARIGAHIFYRG